MGDLDAKWGSASQSTTKELRGLVKHPDGRRVELLVRGRRNSLSRAWAWSFETAGPRVPSSSSMFVYDSADAAMRAAEHMAAASLAAPRRS